MTEENPVMSPVGDPFASWQWNTRLGGGGAMVLIGDGIICWGNGSSCPLDPLIIDPMIPFVGELAFAFFLNISKSHLRNLF